MYALITGASSGMGRDFAKILSMAGYDLILVARNENALSKIKEELETNVVIEPMDLSIIDNTKALYEKYKNYDIEVLINNAGFGDCDLFTESSLDKELNMIDLNIKTLHVLMKLFLQDFIKKNRGYILNVSSMASFAYGPLMATYYSTKSYVTRLSMSVRYELKRMKKNVSISALCPGPVDTNFNNAANVNFSTKGLNSFKVAKYAIKKMFKKKKIIIPGAKNRMFKLLSSLAPKSIQMRFIYSYQKKKIDN